MQSSQRVPDHSAGRALNMRIESAKPFAPLAADSAAGGGASCVAHSCGSAPIHARKAMEVTMAIELPAARSANHRSSCSVSMAGGKWAVRTIGMCLYMLLERPCGRHVDHSPVNEHSSKREEVIDAHPVLRRETGELDAAMQTAADHANTAAVTVDRMHTG